MSRPDLLGTVPVAVRRAACAFHEAGHIVVGWHHERSITHAWLRPPHGVSGETCFEPYRRGFEDERPADVRRAEAEIVILLAGYCGEMIYWNRPENLRWYPGEIYSHGDDLEQMRPYIAFLRPAGETDLRERCAKAAAAILYRPAMLAAQAAIADILVERRRIDREEVEGILRPAMLR